MQTLTCSANIIYISVTVLYGNLVCVCVLILCICWLLYFGLLCQHFHSTFHLYLIHTIIISFALFNLYIPVCMYIYITSSPSCIIKHLSLNLNILLLSIIYGYAIRPSNSCSSNLFPIITLPLLLHYLFR